MCSAGYPEHWVRGLGSDLARAYLGCGFPFSGLKNHEIPWAVDLGCGAGLDVLYLAENHSEIGNILGIDLAPEMLELANATAQRALGKLQFIASDLERLPLNSNFADLVVVNASLNLTASKVCALKEIYRILVPGGYLIGRELVRDGPLPAEILSNPLSHNTSLGGVPLEDDLLEALAIVGFQDAIIGDHKEFSVVWSVAIRATKR